MNTITLGKVDITPVVELAAAPVPRELVFPEIPLEKWREQEALLVPDHWDPEPDIVHMVMRTWVLRSEGKTILVDTAVGNGKDRPNLESQANLRTDFLERLAAAGVKPEDVDFVLTTHLHGDHVGWNTYFDGSNWVPTFSNARYVIPKVDFDFFDPANGHDSRGAIYNLNVFDDSVAPVHDAGLATLWEDEFVVDGGLRIEPAPGHTPGSAVITLASGTDRAVFVGDMLHNPLQVQEPDCCPMLDESETQARATRRRVLGWAADNNALLIPAHIAGTGAMEVGRAGDSFAIKEWAAF